MAILCIISKDTANIRPPFRRITTQLDPSRRLFLAVRENHYEFVPFS